MSLVDTSGNADVPPGITRRPGMGVGGDDDHRRPVGLPGAIDRRFEIAQRSHMLGTGPHRFRVFGEIDGDQPFMAHILEQVVERRHALEGLQAIDHRIAAVVADDDDELVTGNDRGIHVRVHHQIGAVADHRDDVGIRHGHLGAPGAGDLVTHARETELAVERPRGLDLPVLGELARQTAGGGDDAIPLAGLAVHGAHHLRIARKVRVGRPGALRHGVIPRSDKAISPWPSSRPAPGSFRSRRPIQRPPPGHRRRLPARDVCRHRNGRHSRR